MLEELLMVVLVMALGKRFSCQKTMMEDRIEKRKDNLGEERFLITALTHNCSDP